MNSNQKIVLGIAALAASGAIWYAYSSTKQTQTTPEPGPLPIGNMNRAVTAIGDPVMKSSGGVLTTSVAQLMLKTLGNKAGSSAMANLVVNGVYGTATENAVRAFQSIKGIRVDGILGPQTAGVLSDTYRAMRLT